MTAAAQHQPKAALIGVDWGTTNLRIMRIAEGGRILAERRDPRGAAGLNRNDFPEVLAEVAADWMTEAPVLVSGMAGARGRWAETAYAAAPAGPKDLARNLVTVGPGVRIAPGVAMFDGTRLLDVMRGEETQVVGLGDVDEATVVTPGTHSKWIAVRRDAIVDFRTFMTGELYAAVRSATILGQDMGPPGGSSTAFEAGVRRSLADPALTALLFSVRVERLNGAHTPEESADYLSGLLIGAEIAAQPAKGASAPKTPAIVIGAPALTAPYLSALAIAGFDTVRAVDGAATTALGLWRIHEATQS